MHETVALIDDLPSAGLVKGHVGTIVEQLEPDVFLIEFADLNGTTYAVTPVAADQLIKLRHEPTLAA